MNSINLLLFGITRELVGCHQLALELKEDITTVGALKDYLYTQYPKLDELSSLAIAVNGEYAADADAVPAGAEIALIPPVSGG